MDMNKIRLLQRIVYWSPATGNFQRGTIVWISPRRNLIAVQSGLETEFLNEGQVTCNPCAPARMKTFMAYRLLTLSIVQTENAI
jgi:hypothetical protein